MLLNRAQLKRCAHVFVKQQLAAAVSVCCGLTGRDDGIHADISSRPRTSSHGCHTETHVCTVVFVFAYQSLFIDAQCYASTAYAFMCSVCLSFHLSVTFTPNIMAIFRREPPWRGHQMQVRLVKIVIVNKYLAPSCAKCNTLGWDGLWQVDDTVKRQSMLILGDNDEMFMTRTLSVTPKTTEWRLIVRRDKSEA